MEIKGAFARDDIHGLQMSTHEGADGIPEGFIGEGQRKEELPPVIIAGKTGEDNTR